VQGWELLAGDELLVVGIVVWLCLSGLLLRWHLGRLERYKRALAVSRSGVQSSESDPGELERMSWAVLLRRQQDPQLDSLRRRVGTSYLSCGIGWLFGFVAIVNLSVALDSLLQSHLSLPQRLALPQLASTEGGSEIRLFALVTTIGYSAFMVWVLIVALRGRPDWRSGRPGDPIRLSRRSTSVASLAGIALSLIVLGIAWTLTR
jgi:hypothetical protein